MTTTACLPPCTALLAETDLAWAVHTPPILGLVAGLILWAAGGRLLKAGVILTGLMLGALLGLLIGSLIMPGLGSIVGVIAGLVAGGVIATVFYRISVGLTFGVGTALAFAVIGLALAGGRTLPAAVALDDPDDQPNGLGGGEQPLVAPPGTPSYVPDRDPAVTDPGPNPNDVEEPATEPNPASVKNPKAKLPTKPAAKAAKPVAKETKARAGTSSDKPAATPPVAIAPDPAFPGGPADGDGPPRQAAARPAPVRSSILASIDQRAEASDFLTALQGDLSSWWHNTGKFGRTWVIGAGLFGLLSGTLAGLLLPSKAATIITAAVGCALWLPASLWLTRAAGYSWPAPGMMSPLAWVMAWVALALVGVALQSTLGGHAKKPAVKAAKSAVKKRKPSIG